MCALQDLFSILVFSLCRKKKIERKITFDASKTAGRPNCSAVPCERQHKEKKKKTNITMSRHRKKIPLFLSSFLFDAIYRSNSMIGLMMSKKIDESGCDDKQEKKMESSSPVENDTFQTCRARAPHLFDLNCCRPRPSSLSSFPQYSPSDRCHLDWLTTSTKQTNWWKLLYVPSFLFSPSFPFPSLPLLEVNSVPKNKRTNKMTTNIR